MREIGKKDKNICASKWSAMFDIPIVPLFIDIYSLHTPRV